MRASTIALSVYALDKTARVFDSISARARGVGTEGVSAWTQITAAVRTAGLAVAGIVASVKSWADEMSALSDVAAMAGMSTEEITQLNTALNTLGANVGGVNGIARMMGYMQRSIGRVGASGFYQTVRELSRIEDTAKRATAAQQIFGREAFKLGPILAAAAKDGGEALQHVVDAMPGISQAAADAGDATSDAFAIAWAGVKSAFAGAVAEMSQAWNNANIDGDIHASAARAAAYLNYYARMGARWMVAAFDSVSGVIAAILVRPFDAMLRALELVGGTIVGLVKGIWETLAQLGSLLIGDGFDGEAVADAFTSDFLKAWHREDFFKDTFGRDLFVRPDFSDLEKELDEKLKLAENLGKAYKGAAEGVAGDFDASALSGAGITRRNELLQAGTYKAQTFTMRPEYGDVKSELRGIKNILSQIADNTSESSEHDTVKLEVL